MIKYIGAINRDKVNELYGRSRAGIVLYQQAANHVASQPIKMFEFMAAGLPVIASNFPLWKSIIEDNHCGICVNPADAQAVREACERMLRDVQAGETMGRSGRMAVLKKYNWETEKVHLLEVYKEILEEEN